MVVQLRRIQSLLLVLCGILITTQIASAFSPRPSLVSCVCRYSNSRLAPVLASTTQQDVTSTSNRNNDNGEFTWKILKKEQTTTFIGDAQQEQNDKSTSTVLGLPPWLQDLPKGDCLYIYRQHIEHAYSIERLSTSPPIFILRNFLTPNECHDIQQQVLGKHSEQAQTFHNQGTTARPNSSVVWLESCDDIAEDVARTCLSLKQGAWVESLQVLRYTLSGEYVLHHDGHERVLTALRRCLDCG